MKRKLKAMIEKAIGKSSMVQSYPKRFDSSRKKNKRNAILVVTCSKRMRKANNMIKKNVESHRAFLYGVHRSNIN